MRLDRSIFQGAGRKEPASSVISGVTSLSVPFGQAASCVSRVRAARAVMLVPLFVLCFASHGFAWFFGGAVTRRAAAADTAAYVPTISNVEGDLFGGGEGEGRLGKSRSPEGESEKRLLGRFDINNARRVPFMLRFVFGNGSVLKSSKDKERTIRLEGLVLRYRDGGASTRERALSKTEYRGGGYIYEVMFFEEDLQELYNVELWGSLNGDDMAKAGAGSFREDVKMEIEKL